MVRGIGGEIPDISCKYVEIDIFDSHSDFFFYQFKTKNIVFTDITITSIYNV